MKGQFQFSWDNCFLQPLKIKVTIWNWLLSILNQVGIFYSMPTLHSYSNLFFLFMKIELCYYYYWKNMDIKIWMKTSTLLI